MLNLEQKKNKNTTKTNYWQDGLFLNNYVRLNVDNMEQAL